MSRRRSLALYRALLRLYPRRFRNEYGADMGLLFADQLRDESALRVWARGAVDLAITIPHRHLEAHLNRPPNSAVPVLFAAISATALISAALIGSDPAAIGISLPIAAAAAAIAPIAWRTTRPITAARPASAYWWKFLGAGACALATFIVITAATGAVPAPLWWPMMIVLLTALLTLATGLVLGVAQLSAHHTHKGAG
ncbi:MAG: hypothetical protein JWN46_3994 [Acidimicrobiales bacterium]|nr:hypothetical protein [Acidimicrobiales bacterium]